MGSVIANGGVQLSDNESLMAGWIKIGELYIWGDVWLFTLFARWSAGESESGVGFFFL